MKVVSTEALTKLIQLVKSAFIKVDDVVQTQEVTLATVATTGDYDDLTNKPDLSTKANVDLSNINTAGKSFASGLGMPSSRYKNLTLGASGSSYTAPANGYVQLIKFGNQSQFAEIVCGIRILNTAPFNGSVVEIWLPVKKGNSFTVNYDLNGSTAEFKFYYAEGNR